MKPENSNKVYIGNSFHLGRRLIDHLCNRSSNIHLQRALAKIGLDQFYISVLGLLPTEGLTKKDIKLALIKLEQKYIDICLDKYNINPKPGKTRLGSKHSAESKALMSKLRKDNPHFLNKTNSESSVK